MVKSSSPTSRPGVEAASSKYWSMPLKRSAEPTKPGTRWGRCAPGWRNIGSSKVNQVIIPGGAAAQPDWACAGYDIPSSTARQAHSAGISISITLVDQRELDVVHRGIVADGEIDRRYFIGGLRALHIQQERPVDLLRKQNLALVGPVGPDWLALCAHAGQGSAEWKNSVVQAVVLVARLPLAHVNLDAALAECESRKDDRGIQGHVVEFLIILLVMLLGGPSLVGGEIRTHVRDRIDGQREIIILA